MPSKFFGFFIRLISNVNIFRFLHWWLCTRKFQILKLCVCFFIKSVYFTENMLQSLTGPSREIFYHPRRALTNLRANLRVRNVQVVARRWSHAESCGLRRDTRQKRAKDTRKLALSPLFLLCFLWPKSSRLPRCLSSSTSTSLHHVGNKRRDLIIITSWRMGSDAMITAVANLLETPNASFSRLAVSFSLFTAKFSSCVIFCDLVTMTFRRISSWFIFHKCEIHVHDMYTCEDNIMEKFSSSVKQLVMKV